MALNVYSHKLFILQRKNSLYDITAFECNKLAMH